MRFSLRFLFLVVTASSVVLALCAWNLTVGILLSLFALCILVTLIGIQTRRRGVMIVGGALALVAGVTLLAVTSLHATWTAGLHELEVHVFVVDASSLTPLSGATVEVLDGPSWPLEGPPPNVEQDFKIVGRTNPTTDEHGCTEFKHLFPESGRRYVYLESESGTVEMRKVWLRITAPGYRPTFIRVDGQSARLRDMHDETPIIVTVPIGKQ